MFPEAQTSLEFLPFNKHFEPIFQTMLKQYYLEVRIVIER